MEPISLIGFILDVWLGSEYASVKIEGKVFFVSWPYLKNIIKTSKRFLTHFMSLASFYTPSKHKKLEFFVFSGVMEKDQLDEIGFNTFEAF